MALEAVVFPQDPLSYTCNKDNYLYSIAASGGPWSNHEELYGNNVTDSMDQWDSYNSNSSPEPCITTIDHDQASVPGPNNSPLAPVEAATSSNTIAAGAASTGRRKRRRTKSVKNKEEIENQRMTHIAVERNRRKQMNEYLAVLRSLMPPSYVQRGDQASIIGGAINFVKELEQLVQCMNGQKKTKQEHHNNTVPFAEFFMFPQYSTHATRYCNNDNTVYPPCVEAATKKPSWSSTAAVDIEVSLVDSHANMKILSKKQHGLLVKMVIGLQNLGFTILHLNVTTANDMVLTSVSVKVEEGSQLNTVDEIAASVNELLRTIHEEVPLYADHHQL
ncbi:transcription factor bHLH96-like [Arachis stenosperma]|uniref:transcription factor bHLH96-like n=1 Tax=Arachis stenosperma TaxID=217475 RepID=UPI0025ABD54B|nr:transcription factor bHLH96-like [Arachis stenosperma]